MRLWQRLRAWWQTESPVIMSSGYSAVRRGDKVDFYDSSGMQKTSAVIVSRRGLSMTIRGLRWYERFGQWILSKFKQLTTKL